LFLTAVTKSFSKTPQPLTPLFETFYVLRLEGAQMYAGRGYVWQLRELSKLQVGALPRRRRVLQQGGDEGLWVPFGPLFEMPAAEKTSSLDA
jgi:hypothetical protein